MGIKVKGLAVWWMVPLLAVATLAAANDLRLVEAAKQGDKEAVRSLLKQHVLVNSPQADGATPLAWAAYRDDLETADLLIGAGANVNAANDYGATPLSLACNNGSAAMVDKLLKRGANPNVAAWAGETALMECASAGSVDAVRSLLAHGASVNAKETRQGHTALIWAVAQKHPEVARTLIDHGADVHARTKGGFTPLLFAAQQGDMDSARILLTAGANVNEATPEGDTPLLVASLSGHEAFCIFLLDKGADPNAAERNGITALHYAIIKGLRQIVNISLGERTWARYLYRPNMVELVKALLAHGANPNARLAAPAVFNEAGPGYGKILRIDTFNIGNGSPVGATPFLLAAASYDANLMRILVAGGADPTLATEENVTPMMAATGLIRHRSHGALTEEEERGSLEAVKLLVELGADVNAANNLGLTALHGAAFCGLNTVIEFLAQHGANLDAKDKVGQTPLYKALSIKPPSGAPPNVVPVVLRQSTADLLLKLGATPVSDLVARTSDAGAATAGK